MVIASDINQLRDKRDLAKAKIESLDPKDPQYSKNLGIWQGELVYYSTAYDQALTQKQHDLRETYIEKESFISPIFSTAMELADINSRQVSSLLEDNKKKLVLNKGETPESLADKFKKEQEETVKKFAKGSSVEDIETALGVKLNDKQKEIWNNMNPEDRNKILAASLEKALGKKDADGKSFEGFDENIQQFKDNIDALKKQGASTAQQLQSMNAAVKSDTFGWVYMEIQTREAVVVQQMYKGLSYDPDDPDAQKEAAEAMQNQAKFQQEKSAKQPAPTPGSR